MSRLSFRADKPLFGLGILISVLILTESALATERLPDRQGVYLAPGWGKLSFAAPQAGSYQLPVIDIAADGQVLDSKGKTVSLNELMAGKITLLSFIYRTCDDVNGCPLSTMVLNSVGRKVAEHGDLSEKLKMLTLSFDPEFDTPEAMAEFRKSILGDTQLDWQFLTTGSEQQIAPILEAYQQTVIADQNSEGQRKKFSHILRVYLIDGEQQIRNIYSVSFLHPDILVNDVKTLILEQSQPPSSIQHAAK